MRAGNLRQIATIERQVAKLLRDPPLDYEDLIWSRRALRQKWGKEQLVAAIDRRLAELAPPTPVTTPTRRRIITPLWATHSALERFPLKLPKETAPPPVDKIDAKPVVCERCKNPIRRLRGWSNLVYSRQRLHAKCEIALKREKRLPFPDKRCSYCQKVMVTKGWTKARYEKTKMHASCARVWLKTRPQGKPRKGRGV